jgi:hypothetical protein
VFPQRHPLSSEKKNSASQKYRAPLNSANSRGGVLDFLNRLVVFSRGSPFFCIPSHQAFNPTKLSADVTLETTVSAAA